MNTTSLVALALIELCLTAMPSFAQDELVLNGGFELPAVGPSGVTTLQSGDLPGWTLERGTPDLTGFWQDAAGKQSLDLSGPINDASIIYQDIRTTPGQTYRFRFALAGNPQGQPVVKSVNAFWDGKALGPLFFDTTNLGNENMGWRHFGFTVLATRSITRIRFESLTSSGFGPVLDDVSAAPTDAPDFLSIQLFPGMQVSGLPDRSYRVEYTEDFLAWKKVEDVTLSTTPRLVIDTDGVISSRRFYRAVLLPVDCPECLFDDFNFDFINGNRWTVSKRFESGQVVASNGKARFLSGGVLNTIASFGDKVEVRGRFRFLTAQDTFNVVLRSDLSAVGSFGHRNGIIVAFEQAETHVLVAEAPAPQLGIADYAFVVNADYDFRITDVGGMVKVYINDLATPILAVSSAFRPGDKIAVYNREAADGVVDLDFIGIGPLP